MQKEFCPAIFQCIAPLPILYDRSLTHSLLRHSLCQKVICETVQSSVLDQTSRGCRVSLTHIHFPPGRTPPPPTPTLSVRGLYLKDVCQSRSGRNKSESSSGPPASPASRAWWGGGHCLSKGRYPLHIHKYLLSYMYHPYFLVLIPLNIPYFMLEVTKSSKSDFLNRRLLIEITHFFF